VRARQTAVHPVGVLRVGLSVLAGQTGALLLVSVASLLHKGPCKQQHEYIHEGSRLL